MKAVNWVCKAGQNLASYRMRCKIPSDCIQEHYEDYSAQVLHVADPYADVNIFTKHFQATETIKDISHIKTLASTAGNPNSSTVFDICDDHFTRPHGDYYRTMCGLADVVTCNTERMKQTIFDHTGREAFVIPDPISFPFQTPYVPRDKDSLSTLWFGHVSNLKPVLEREQEILSGGDKLTLITNGSGLAKEHITWSVGTVEEKIVEFDAVVIPVDRSVEYSYSKSPNRAVDAIHSGRIVITNGEEIYGDLRDYLVICDDFAEGLEWVKKNPAAVYNKINKGQEFILKNYDWQTVTDKWIEVVEIATKT